jgi:hypothetical protein
MHVSLQDISFRKSFFLAFVSGFIVRLIPEVLSYPYPIGFDTIYYAWRIESGVVWHHWSQAFSTWLLYGILVPVYNVVSVDPFLLLKLMAPLLFGFNACGIYYFATRAFGWTTKKSLLATFFFSFQIAALAISWQYARNMLGLGILLFTLPWLHKGLKTKRELGVFAMLSILVVLGHELASVILFAVVLGIVISEYLKNQPKTYALKVLMAVLPAFVVFLVGAFFVVRVSMFTQENVIVAYQSVGHYEGPFFFFTNYLTVYDTVQHYSTYLDLVSHVFSLFSVFFIIALPLVFVGFFRDKILDGWSVLLLVGSFGALITPFFALNVWHRWMRMLVFPFTFYVINGVDRVFGAMSGSVAPNFRWLGWMKLSRRTVKGIIVLSCSLGSLFAVTPLFYGRAGLFGLPMTTNYLPSSMLSNTVPVQDVAGVIDAMRWVDEEMVDGSALLVHDAFLSWSELCLDSGHMKIYFEDDIEGAVTVALEGGFDPVYLVWWNEDIGWYGLSIPEDFLNLFSSGRIAVFEHHS